MDPEGMMYGFGVSFGISWAILKLFGREKKGKDRPREDGTQQQPSESKGEAACRDAAYRITGKRFEKIRHKGIVNPDTGRALELDCYSKSLKTAIEYQGRQHYDRQHERDCYKRAACQKLGIKLIEVPYTVKDIEGYLRKVL
ncbi:P8.141C-like protein [Frog virus 3]|uniref:P8.141C-like protein n=1 Tax=Frog virus 3 TaxID=10493 RepID=A0A5B8P211_FRG3V|nr:P8.141C-like protein [Frog virus 3]